MMQILRREPASFDLPLRLMTRRGQELVTASEIHIQLQVYMTMYMN